MEWSRIRFKILALYRFDVQHKLKERNLPSGILPIPRLFLELAMSELSPVEFKIFLKLYSMLDFELKTHWVIGVSTQELVELCHTKKTIVYKALNELKRKGYIYVLSGQRAKKKAKAIRKMLYGSAVDFGGNDYNAYSLLPFFTRVFIELDTQRFEEGENENPLPSDKEVIAELPPETTNALNSLKDKDEKGVSVYIDLTTNTSNSLKDKDEKGVSVYIDQPQSIETNLGLYRPSSVYIDDNQRYTNQRNTNQRHTHQRQEAPAEKNPPPNAQPSQTLEPQSPEKPSCPADQLPEPVYKTLLDYLRGQDHVKSPIAVLKSLGEKELIELTREVLSEELKYDYELQEEVRRIIDQLPDISEVELLEYVLLSEEGRLEWLENRGINLKQDLLFFSREEIEETIRELIERFRGNLEQVKQTLKGLYGRDETKFEEVKRVWRELKENGKLQVDKQANFVRWIE